MKKQNGFSKKHDEDFPKKPHYRKAKIHKSHQDYFGQSNPLERAFKRRGQ